MSEILEVEFAICILTCLLDICDNTFKFETYPKREQFSNSDTM